MKLFSLRISWLIQKILKKGKTIHTPFFVCKYVKSTTNKSAFCVIVSKKVSKKAVERNFIRRRIKEALRKNIESLSTPVQVVVIGKKKAGECEFKELCEATKKNIKEIS